MTEVNGTEAVETEAVVAPVFAGLSFKVNQKMNALAEARDLAFELESGLDTQAAINKISVSLRDSLIAISRELHGMYADVLPLRAGLLASVGEVAKENKKAALAAKIAADQALLASL